MQASLFCQLFSWIANVEYSTLYLWTILEYVQKVLQIWYYQTEIRGINFLLQHSIFKTMCFDKQYKEWLSKDLLLANQSRKTLEMYEK